MCTLVSQDRARASESCTDLSVTDCAERLQVVQGALPSSTEHRLDVVHLPEMSLPWGSYHFIELQREHKISTFLHTRWELLVLHCVIMFIQQNHREKYIRMAFYCFFCE